MEFLKKLLSEATYKKLTEQLGEELTKQVGEKTKEFEIDISAEKLIPKDVFNAEREKIKTHTVQIAERDKQLAELAEKAKGNDALLLQIKELQETNVKAQAEYDSKTKELSQTFAFKEALNQFKPKNTKALEALIDRQKLEFKENNGSFEIKGLSEQIEGLKKSDSYLFGEVVTGTGGPQNGGQQQQIDTNAFGFNFTGVRPDPNKK
jgi:hypothetical protein